MYINEMQLDKEIEGKAYVHWKAWQEAYASLLPQEFLQERRTLDSCRQQAFAYPQNTLVAIIEEKVVGFSCYGQSNSSDLSDAGEVYALYVLADYYHQKIGYQLLQATFEKLSAYNKIVLWVVEGNHRAISFYEKVGFSFDGAKKVVELGKEITEYRMVFSR